MELRVPEKSFPFFMNDPEFWIRRESNGSDGLIHYRIDAYGGVVLQSDTLPVDSAEFTNKLQESLLSIGAAGFDKAVWLSIPVSHIHLLSICVRHFDFYIHNSTRERVMVVKWSHPTKPDPIPDQSTHQVGVGCVIRRGDSHILLVKERTGPAAIGKGIWKLPTGLVEDCEDLEDAAIRETKEETGLDCIFKGILCFRHSHGGNPMLGSVNDLFYVCLLSMADDEQVPTVQESEITECMWVPISDIHITTECKEGTAAWHLMEFVRQSLSAPRPPGIIVGRKLPAWRRQNCEQWVYHPTLECDNP
jgi:ADP-ribose pyrophosphatase YjhB (NUDIX family)